MKLLGGNYGGYELTLDSIVLEGNSISITFYDSNIFFFVIDDYDQKWYYKIDELVQFIGMNLY